ncbi:sodium channel subunit beta-1 [Colossoma macropomum]|uniref:sodium channel subunit beta-1 n=1 Tax=Colossoma macropomum TaxID=42526 RepID=UPI001864F201|nr:sodium channel subunit beta-1 [Colossoma macropomum]
MSLKIDSFLVLCVVFICAPQCHAGCAEVDSMTEAVAGESFMLGCISCKRREEVSGETAVDWHFKPDGTDEFYHIFHYEYPLSTILHKDFEGRLEWHGTEGTADIQIGAIFIHNVTYNDTGTYTCTFERTLFLPPGEQHVTIQKTVELAVVPEANRELTALISEIMMYVLIVVLQLWMIGVLIYCYKKIYAENEAREARKALRDTNKLIDPKDTCDGVHLE